MNEHSRLRLWLRIALPFLLFVVAGSLALTAFVAEAHRQKSREQFDALARENAEFIRTIHLPLTDRFAGYLGRALNVTVQFRSTGEPHPELPGREVATAPLEAGMELALIRDRPATSFTPATGALLGAFWALSLALAWAVLRLIEERRRRQASEKLAVLGTMATGLAHEIQNPVSAIRMHAQLLASAPPAELPAATAAALPVMLGEAAAIEGLVNQWMFLARPEPPQTSPVSVAELVDAVVQTVTPMAGHARVKIERQIPAGWRVRGDARRLAQAAGNVVRNAIQAMPGGGTLKISAQRNGAGFVHVEFADTGSGFSAAALARHAELFYSEREGGMGIGLSVCDEILRAHGGALRVANCASGGAVVRFELPALEENPA